MSTEHWARCNPNEKNSVPFEHCLEGKKNTDQFMEQCLKRMKMFVLEHAV